MCRVVLFFTQINFDILILFRMWLFLTWVKTFLPRQLRLPQQQLQQKVQLALGTMSCQVKQTNKQNRPFFIPCNKIVVQCPLDLRKICPIGVKTNKQTKRHLLLNVTKFKQVMQLLGPFEPFWVSITVATHFRAALN